MIDVHAVDVTLARVVPSTRWPVPRVSGRQPWDAFHCGPGHGRPAFGGYFSSEGTCAAKAR